MRLFKIFNGMMAPGETRPNQLHRSQINGLMITVDLNQFLEADRVTVTLRDQEGTTVLVQRIGLRHFADITDIEAGQGRGTDGVDAYSFALVDLGSLYLDDASLSIELESASAATGPRRFGVYSYLKDLDVDYFRSYSIVRQNDVRMSDVERLYVFTSVTDAPADFLLASDFDVVVTDEDSVYMADALGLRCATNIFGQVEGTQKRNLLKLYDISEDLPQTVHVRKSGAHADNIHLIEVQRTYSANRVRAGLGRARERYANRISRLKTAQPELSRALSEAGVII
jgi:hypothetical protein